MGPYPNPDEMAYYRNGEVKIELTPAFRFDVDNRGWGEEHALFMDAPLIPYALRLGLLVESDATQEIVNRVPHFPNQLMTQRSLLEHMRRDTPGWYKGISHQR